MRALLPEPREDLDDDALRAIYAMGAPGNRHVRCNFVTSLDGAVEIDGVSKPLSSTPDKRLFGIQRSLADVILVGQATAVAESYGPAGAPYGGLPPPIALIARTMRLDPASAFFTEAKSRPFLLVPDDTDVSAYADVADVLRCGPSMALAAGLSALAERGLTRVLCEGGPRILGDLVGAGLLDELCLTTAPVLAGPGGKPLVGGDRLSDPPAHYRLTGLLEEDGVLFGSYACKRA